MHIAAILFCDYNLSICFIFQLKGKILLLGMETRLTKQKQIQVHQELEVGNIL